MKANLAALRTEIQEHLKSRGMVLFHSFERSGDPGPAVYWDTSRDNDFRSFIAAAEAAGVRLITLYCRELDEELVEDALEQLSDTNLEREERRAMEKRLREMRAYVGFTCQIELSFDYEARVYIFDVRTSWFDDLTDLIDSIDDAFLDPEGGNSRGIDGGYFSRN